jgi:hypothetical protein
VGPSGTIVLGGVSHATWPAGGASFWLQSPGNVGIYTTGPGDNVGIGTTSPTSLFQTNGAGQAIITNQVSIGTTSAPTAPLYVYGNGRVIATNNVAVGTTAPLANLHIVGTGLIEAPNVSLGTGLPGNTLDVKGTLTYNALEVTPAGNVGVGTGVPGNILDVWGTVSRFQVGSTGVILGGNLGGGTTGNVGIGTFGATTTTCDSVCNTTNNRRCFNGVTSGGVPTACSVSITGTCLCLPAS